MRSFVYVAVLVAILQSIVVAQKAKKKTTKAFKPRFTRIRDCYKHDNYFFCNEGDIS